MWRVLTILGLVVAGWPAQATEPAALRADLDRLQGEVAALGRIELAQAQPDNLRTAALEVELSRLQEQLRQLTGRIEEVEHAQRQLTQRIDGLVADLDARLPGGGRSASAPATPSVAEPPRPAAPAPAATQPPTRIAPDAAARQGYVLGTVPETAVRSQQPPAAVAATPAPGAQAKLEPGGADTDYKAALDLLQAGKWADAEQAFSAFVRAYPSDPRAPTAAYWLGETYFFRKDYPTAASTFAGNYRTYGEAAPRAPDNLLKLGMALAAMGDRDRACQTFAELAKRHPNAPAPIRQALSREKAAAGCS